MMTAEPSQPAQAAAAQQATGEATAAAAAPAATENAAKLEAEFAKHHDDLMRNVGARHLAGHTLQVHYGTMPAETQKALLGSHANFDAFHQAHLGLTGEALANENTRIVTALKDAKYGETPAKAFAEKLAASHAAHGKVTELANTMAGHGHATTVGMTKAENIIAQAERMHLNNMAPKSAGFAAALKQNGGKTALLAGGVLAAGYFAGKVMSDRTQAANEARFSGQGVG